MTETIETGLIKYNTDEILVTETLVAGLIKNNTDESLVTETLETGLIKYNIHLWPLLQRDIEVFLPEEIIFLWGEAREKYDF